MYYGLFKRFKKRKNYYLEGMKVLFIGRENFDNFEDILTSYKNILSEKEEHIQTLFNEIKVLKKIKV